MVSEYSLVIQIKIIITNLRLTASAAPKAVVKCSIQMIILSIQPDNIPCMSVLNTFFRIISANGYDAPEIQCITQNFH